MARDRQARSDIDSAHRPVRPRLRNPYGGAAAPGVSVHLDNEPAGGERSAHPQPWQRLRDESAAAYAAFLQFRDLGPGRSIAQIAQATGKSLSLLYRWSSRHRWVDRAWQWDLVCSREEDAVLREQRQEMLRRQLRDSDRLQRLAMAKLTALVRRDPISGELELDPAVKVRDATDIYRLALKIQEGIAPTTPQAQEAEESGDDQLRRMSDAELQELIRLARERASGNETTREETQ